MVSEWIVQARASLVNKALEEIRSAKTFQELYLYAKTVFIHLGRVRDMETEGYGDRLDGILGTERNFWKAKSLVVQLARDYLVRYIK